MSNENNEVLYICINCILGVVFGILEKYLDGVIFPEDPPDPPESDKSDQASDPDKNKKDQVSDPGG